MAERGRGRQPPQPDRLHPSYGTPSNIHTASQAHNDNNDDDYDDDDEDYEDGASTVTGRSYTNSEYTHLSSEMETGGLASIHSLPGGPHWGHSTTTNPTHRRRLPPSASAASINGDTVMGDDDDDDDPLLPPLPPPPITKTTHIHSLRALKTLEQHERKQICGAIFPPTLALLIDMGAGPGNGFVWVLTAEEERSASVRKRREALQQAVEAEQRYLIKLLARRFRSHKWMGDTRALLRKAMEGVRSVTIGGPGGVVARLGRSVSFKVKSAMGQERVQTTPSPSPSPSVEIQQQVGVAHQSQQSSQQQQQQQNPPRRRYEDTLCNKHRHLCHGLVHTLLTLIQREIGPSLWELVKVRTHTKGHSHRVEESIRGRHSVLDYLIDSLLQLNSYWLPPDEFLAIFQVAPAHPYVKNKCEGCMITAVMASEHNLLLLRTAVRLRERPLTRPLGWDLWMGVVRINSYDESVVSTSDEQDELLKWIGHWMELVLKHNCGCVACDLVLGNPGTRHRDREDLREASETVVREVREIWRVEKKALRRRMRRDRRKSKRSSSSKRRRMERRERRRERKAAEGVAAGDGIERSDSENHHGSSSRRHSISRHNSIAAAADRSASRTAKESGHHGAGGPSNLNLNVNVKQGSIHHNSNNNNLHHHHHHHHNNNNNNNNTTSSSGSSSSSSTSYSSSSSVDSRDTIRPESSVSRRASIKSHRGSIHHVHEYPYATSNPITTTSSTPSAAARPGAGNLNLNRTPSTSRPKPAAEAEASSSSRSGATSGRRGSRNSRVDEGYHTDSFYPRLSEYLSAPPSSVAGSRLIPMPASLVGPSSRAAASLAGGGPSSSSYSSQAGQSTKGPQASPLLTTPDPNPHPQTRTQATSPTLTPSLTPTTDPAAHHPRSGSPDSCATCRARGGYDVHDFLSVTDLDAVEDEVDVEAEEGDFGEADDDGEDDGEGERNGDGGKGGKGAVAGDEEQREKERLEKEEADRARRLIDVQINALRGAWTPEEKKRREERMEQAAREARGDWRLKLARW